LTPVFSSAKKRESTGAGSDKTNKMSLSERPFDVMKGEKAIGFLSIALIIAILI
jgi:hypothetical protein